MFFGCDNKSWLTVLYLNGLWTVLPSMLIDYTDVNWIIHEIRYFIDDCKAVVRLFNHLGSFCDWIKMARDIFFQEVLFFKSTLFTFRNEISMWISHLLYLSNFLVLKINAKICKKIHFIFIFVQVSSLVFVLNK